MNEFTVVICTYNRHKIIDKCLMKILQNSISILVYGMYLLYSYKYNNVLLLAVSSLIYFSELSAYK